MGYLNNNNTIAGKNLWAPSFTAIGYNTIGLSTIKVTMPDGTMTGLTSGANFIQTMDKDGNLIATYSWKSTGQGSNKKWGWQKSDGTKITADNEVNITRGDGFILDSQAKAMVFVSNGEVGMEPYTYSAPVAGKNIMANPFPATLGLSTVKVTMPDGTTTGLTSGANFIQTMDKDGNLIATYSWKSTGQGGNKKWGWQKSDGTKITADNDIEIFAGEAFILDAQAKDMKFIFSL